MAAHRSVLERRRTRAVGARSSVEATMAAALGLPVARVGPLVVVEHGSRGSWSGVDSRAAGASSPAEATMSAAVGFPVTRRVPTGTGSGGGTPDLVVWPGRTMRK